ncbi:hypothetical protein GGR50DRAFT_702133 [Xylaria sp. CBS 124048]|nr:hypothetical protein GGR50DRAFT_702133 [Xylaria sp. CBS 124048]
MASWWASKETFHRVTAQPGSTAKPWDKEELVRCGATGTNIAIETSLRGHAHPIFARWIKDRPELHKELEQPILLASKILEAAGLPWLSDFLTDDVFDDDYPGRECHDRLRSTTRDAGSVVPYSIARHHRASWENTQEKTRWMGSAQDTLRQEVPKLILWQIDEVMFREKGWSGYTCRHPRGNLSLSKLDRYETIELFDSLSPHEDSRNLTILIMAEYPARLADLRRQGKSRSEEYLLTAFMTTVTLLHEIGHTVYWKHRRALTRDLREPFYGSDLEMELGDSFIAAIFGGWIPVPVRDPIRLRKDFSFSDGVAWRQALSWDHHRMRPKYRAHYSIPIEYIARLFTQTSWSTASEAAALIRPLSLTGDSMALRTVGLHTVLTQGNQHATAAIADFHCTGDGWTWNRRPGARFRIPQYDGCLYPELELPTAAEDVIREPEARARQPTISASEASTWLMRNSIESCTANTKPRRMTDAIDVRMQGQDVSSALSPSLMTTATEVTRSPSLKSRYTPPKGTLPSPIVDIPRPVAKGSPLPGAGTMRKRHRARTLPRAQYAGVKPLPWSSASSSAPLPSPPLSPSGSAIQGQAPQQIQQQQAQQQQAQQEEEEEEAEDKTKTKNNNNNNKTQFRDIKDTGKLDISQQTVRHGREQDGGRGAVHGGGGKSDRAPGGSEISVDELRQRLSRLIGVSLTEMENLFEGPRFDSAGMPGYLDVD